MNTDLDETEKYLTKSSKRKTEKLNLQDNNRTKLVENGDIGKICFNSSSVSDGIPGLEDNYNNQIVVTLLPAADDESTSDKLEEDLNAQSFSKLPTTSSEDIYLPSYTTDVTGHLSSSQARDNMIYAELQIAPDAESSDPDYEVMDFQAVKLPTKRKSNNKKGPLSTTTLETTDPVRNLWVTSKSHKQQLQDCGHTWTTGMWSKEETNILKANIDRFCQAKGITDPGDIIFRTSREERRNFYPTIASGLNRPLFSVYRRVKRLYDHTNHKGRYSSEEVDKLKQLTKIHGRNWSTIANQLGRSSDSVKDRVRLIKNDLTSGKWKPGEEQRLAAAVHAVSRTKHGESVTEGIQWPAVAKIVGTRTEKQCRTKWLNYLNWKLISGREWTKADDKLLVQKIAALNPATENDINWSEISTGWESVRSPSWLRRKWYFLKKILAECGLGDISFTDTVKLLNKLFSQNITEVWDKPRQLVKFLIGVQKATNKAEASGKRIAKKKVTEPPPEPQAVASPTLFMTDDATVQSLSPSILTLVPDENSCPSITEQQSLNSIVRPRSSSESVQAKVDFDVPTTSSATELVCEAAENGINLPPGTFQLTPTSSEGVYIIETADPAAGDGAIPGNMDRVVNITVSPEVLKTMLEQREPWLGQQQQAEELHFTESTGQEYLAEDPSNSGENPVLGSVARDVVVDSIESDDDVSIYVT